MTVILYWLPNRYQLPPVLSHLKKKDMEIKPQDLRVGNIVWSVEAQEPTEIFLMGIHRLLEEERDNKPRSYKPIQLTPEWLDRFGFDNSFLKLKTFYQGQKTLTLKVTVNMTVAALLVEHIDGKFSEYIPFPIKHVHQLQNLYFALTGEELAIDKQISNGN